jgi:hypothetical protein
LEQWFWRRRFLNDSTPFLRFCDYLPFEANLALYLNKLEFPLPKDNVYQVWLNLACWLWRKNFFYFFSAFLLFRYYLPLEKSYPLHLNKRESPLPKNDMCQVWLKLAQWFFKWPTVFLHFCDYLPFEEDLVLYLNKLEFPSPMDNFYQVWLNLACWFWRKRFLKIFSAFLLFCYYLPLEKTYPLHLKKLECPLPKDDLCQVCLKLVQWFWRRSGKCNSLQMDGRTTGDQNFYSSLGFSA